ncbi:hypothetical protein PG999_002059 [Apiospora kogelbergensis]|uniref:Uncharacterized protein n=1 Tax=Apiospora kogelbergensis TaxID=1337665 RepID=A0AAW0R7A7_9PEZI
MILSLGLKFVPILGVRSHGVGTRLILRVRRRANSGALGLLDALVDMVHGRLLSRWTVVEMEAMSALGGPFRRRSHSASAVVTRDGMSRGQSIGAGILQLRTLRVGERLATERNHSNYSRVPIGQVSKGSSDSSSALLLVEDFSIIAVVCFGAARSITLALALGGVTVLASLLGRRASSVIVIAFSVRGGVISDIFTVRASLGASAVTALALATVVGARAGDTASGAGGRADVERGGSTSAGAGTNETALLLLTLELSLTGLAHGNGFAGNVVLLLAEFHEVLSVD